MARFNFKRIGLFFVGIILLASVLGISIADVGEQGSIFFGSTDIGGAKTTDTVYVPKLASFECKEGQIDSETYSRNNSSINEKQSYWRSAISGIVGSGSIYGQGSEVREFKLSQLISAASVSTFGMSTNCDGVYCLAKNGFGQCTKSGGLFIWDAFNGRAGNTLRYDSKYGPIAGSFTLGSSYGLDSARVEENSEMNMRGVCLYTSGWGIFGGNEGEGRPSRMILNYGIRNKELRIFTTDIPWGAVIEGSAGCSRNDLREALVSGRAGGSVVREDGLKAGTPVDYVLNMFGALEKKEYKEDSIPSALKLNEQYTFTRGFKKIDDVEGLGEVVELESGKKVWISPTYNMHALKQIVTVNGRTVNIADEVIGKASCLSNIDCQRNLGSNFQCVVDGENILCKEGAKAECVTNSQCNQGEYIEEGGTVYWYKEQCQQGQCVQIEKSSRVCNPRTNEGCPDNAPVCVDSGTRCISKITGLLECPSQCCIDGGNYKTKDCPSSQVCVTESGFSGICKTPPSQYIVGDGLCQSDLGETAENSPKDCGQIEPGKCLIEGQIWDKYREECICPAGTHLEAGIEKESFFGLFKEKTQDKCVKDDPLGIGTFLMGILVLVGLAVVLHFGSLWFLKKKRKQKGGN